MYDAYYQPFIIFLIGLILIFLYRGRKERKSKILQDGVMVQGTVISLDTDLGTDMITAYYPIVEFELKDGQSVSMKYSEGYSPSRYRVNERVIIHYSPNDPQQFLIKDSRIDWIGIGLLIFGSSALVQSTFSFYQIYFHK